MRGSDDYNLTSRGGAGQCGIVFPLRAAYTRRCWVVPNKHRGNPTQHAISTTMYACSLSAVSLWQCWNVNAAGINCAPRAYAMRCEDSATIKSVLYDVLALYRNYTHFISDL